MAISTLGGTFSGIGGFELAWRQLGGQVAWTCEINDAEREFLQAQFDAPCHPDVTDLDPYEVAPVDVFVGGSPCQGFSIAGTRDGLEHGESRLFADYVRVMEGLAERGLKYAVWENVPGVFSITNDADERTFEHVVAALVGSTRPVHLDRSEPWYAGLAVASDGRRAVAWRTFDSRHFGVPQRRRRVFACVAFGGAAAERAIEVLLVREGVRGDLAACSQEGQDVANAVTRSLGGGGADDNQAQGQHLVANATVTGQHTHALTAEGHDAGEDGTGRGTPIVVAFNWQQGDAEYRVNDDGTTPTLSTTSAPAVLLRNREGKPGGGKGPLLSEDESLTPATGNDQILFAPDVAQPLRGNPYNNSDPGMEARMHIGTRYGVRRLTPVECERLQAFPDGWTEPLGSDSARYRALGNAVTVNVVRHILGRIRAVEVPA